MTNWEDAMSVFATSGWISHCNITIDYKLMRSLDEVSNS